MTEEEKDHTTDEYVEAIKQLIERAGFDSFLVILIKEGEVVDDKANRCADEFAGGDIRDIAIALNMVLKRNPVLKLALLLDEGVEDLSVREVPY